MSVWIVLFFLFMCIDTYLVFLIGMKFVKPSISYHSTRIWLPALLLSIISIFEKYFFLEYSKETSLINLFLYFILVLIFVQATFKSKVLAYITMVVTLISSEIIGFFMTVSLLGINMQQIMNEGYFRPETLVLGLTMTFIKVVILLIISKWKVRSVESAQ